MLRLLSSLSPIKIYEPLGRPLQNEERAGRCRRRKPGTESSEAAAFFFPGKCVVVADRGGMNTASVVMGIAAAGVFLSSLCKEDRGWVAGAREFSRGSGILTPGTFQVDLSEGPFIHRKVPPSNLLPRAPNSRGPPGHSWDKRGAAPSIWGCGSKNWVIRLKSVEKKS